MRSTFLMLPLTFFSFFLVTHILTHVVNDTFMHCSVLFFFLFFRSRRKSGKRIDSFWTFFTNGLKPYRLVSCLPFIYRIPLESINGFAMNWGCMSGIQTCLWSKNGMQGCVECTFKSTLRGALKKFPSASKSLESCTRNSWTRRLDRMVIL